MNWITVGTAAGAASTQNVTLMSIDTRTGLESKDPGDLQVVTFAHRTAVSASSLYPDEFRSAAQDVIGEFSDLASRYKRDLIQLSTGVSNGTCD